MTFNVNVCMNGSTIIIISSSSSTRNTSIIIGIHSLEFQAHAHTICGVYFLLVCSCHARARKKTSNGLVTYQDRQESHSQLKYEKEMGQSGYCLYVHNTYVCIYVYIYLEVVLYTEKRHDRFEANRRERTRFRNFPSHKILALNSTAIIIIL